MASSHPESLVERAARRRALEQKLRTAWLAGAVEEWQHRVGRLPTDDELRRIVAGYDWSVPE
jgi:hypothetical protein